MLFTALTGCEFKPKSKNGGADLRTAEARAKIYTATFLTPSPKAWINLDNYQNVEFSGTCDGVDEGTIELTGLTDKVDLGTARCQSHQWRLQANLSLLKDGPQNIQLLYSDPSGSNPTISSLSIVKDTQAPVVTLHSEDLGINVKNFTSFTVSGQCTENGLPVIIKASTGIPLGSSAWKLPQKL